MLSTAEDLYVFDQSMIQNSTSFTNVTTEAGLTALGDLLNTRQRLGSAWGDFNSDGLPDLYIPNHEQFSPLLYQNNGDGTFSNVSQANLPEFTATGSNGLFSDTHQAAWADFDNDGDQDIFQAVGLSWLVASRSSNLLLVNNSGTLEDLAESQGVDFPRARSQGMQWFDFDNDGLLDLFLAAKTRPSADLVFSPPTVFRNMGSGFEDVKSSTVPDLVSAASAVLSDVSGDGKLDLVVFGTTDLSAEVGRVIVYDISADGPFVEIPMGEVNQTANFILDKVVVESRDMISADFNGDLEMDLYLSRAVSDAAGQEKAGQLFINNGQELEDKTLESGISSNSFGSSAVVGDFNNDMHVDLYLTDVLYLNQGDGTFTANTDVFDVTFPESTTVDDVAQASTADFNLDGFLDLFVTSLPAPGQLLQNQGNANNWLLIDLEGSSSNRDGIGAQLFLTAGGVTQLREKNNGSHKFSQDHQRIHFGLARNEVADSLDVRWFSGIVNRHQSVAADQLLTIQEGQGLKGSDVLIGNTDANILSGWAGDDVLRGNLGNDTLRGGARNDVLEGGLGADILNGGKGFDTAEYINSTAGVKIRLGNNTAGRGESAGDRLRSIERIVGSNFNDRLSGDQKRNTLEGGNRSDFLAGNGDKDTLIGGRGGDILIGGRGDDLLTGGLGADAFRFNDSQSEGIDTITDFKSQLDSIQINGSRFGGGLLGGALKSTQFVLGLSATNANHRFIYDQGTGNLFFDEDGSGIESQSLFAVLDSQPSVVANDIQIF